MALSPSSWWRDGLALTKPRITLLSVGVAAAGMAIAPPDSPGFSHAWLSLCGIGLLVASSSVLNMHAERAFDALMPRTQNRPLPAGRWHPHHAWMLGWGLAILAA